jgi:hypothetical protein
MVQDIAQRSGTPTTGRAPTDGAKWRHRPEAGRQDRARWAEQKVIREIMLFLQQQGLHGRQA